MPIVKMKYGIDLGTTNSSLCKFENGKLTIIKTDTLKDTMPSCVSFTKKCIVKTGDSAYNDLRADKARATKKWLAENENVFLEFKRTMGLDKKYKSSYTKKSYSSEELSAEVLKSLLSFVKDTKVKACVITIPAKFKTDQIAATMRAAKLAGIEHCELLQEPIAAAFAYGLSAQEKDGNWVVFDFGGGTFDAALLNVQDGILQVKDTEGDNYLGGKNLDFAIVDQIFIPYLRKHNSIDQLMSKPVAATILREGLKFYAEQAKNQLSFTDICDVTSQLDEFGNDDKGNEIELDLTVSKEELKVVIEPFFQKAIDICKKLLERNNLTGEQITSLILVGGPTHSPLLRQMLRDQITPNVNTNIDPMTAVALGSALFASTIDYEETLDEEDSKVLPLEVSYEANSVEMVEYVTIKPHTTDNAEDVKSNFTVELVRNDNAWSSGKVNIPPTGEVIECFLQEGKPNAFKINAYDENGTLIPCFPNEISILQGTKIVNAVLPYYIGIEVTDVRHNKDVFASLKGLEKNVLIPAVGVINELKVPKELNPGRQSDRIVIPIYQGEYDANGTSALCNDHVFDVVITGNDVTSVVAANSDMDIIIKVDRSQMMTLEATFAETGETIEKTIEVSQRKGVDLKKLNKFFDDAKSKIQKLKTSDIIPNDELTQADTLLNDVINRFNAEKIYDDGRMHLLADLRRAFLEMEKVEKHHEWEDLEKKLDKLIQSIINANNDLGNRYNDEVARAQKQLESVKEKRDVKIGQRTVKDFESLFGKITIDYQVIAFVAKSHTHFNPSRWANPKKAKQIIDAAFQVISSGSYNMYEVYALLDGLIPIANLTDGNKAMLLD